MESLLAPVAPRLQVYLIKDTENKETQNIDDLGMCYSWGLFETVANFFESGEEEHEESSNPTYVSSVWPY